MATKKINLKGSERKPIPNAKSVSTLVPADEIVEITITVRRKKALPEKVVHAGALTHSELAGKYGASAADLKAAEDFASKHNLTVISKNALERSVKVKGTLADLQSAFGTKLKPAKVDGTICRERTGSLKIPADLEPVIEGVFGLDNRPQAKPRFRIAPKVNISYTPLDVARLYNFPAGTGKGQTIAIIELGGGFVQADLTTYFSGLGVGAPNVIAVPIDGATNAPTGDPNGADGEVMLDIEIVGAIVPQAKIKVYFAPNTDKGFLDAINAAIHDTDIPAAISISWGGPEETWTAQSRTAFEGAFQNAAALSIQVVTASGDNGSTDGTKKLTVDFPASAPHAIGCGGTHMEGGVAITKEVVWNYQGGSTGGGVSAFFPKPSYQSAVKVPVKAGGGRGVPDVCGNAAVETGYKVRVDGQDAVFGGTSAVAPLWAGLIARISQNLGKRIPFLNGLIYTKATAFRDITSGNNDVGGGGGKYAAAKGWDACTGLGSPNGGLLLAALKSSAVKGATKKAVAKKAVGKKAAAKKATPKKPTKKTTKK